VRQILKKQGSTHAATSRPYLAAIPALCAAAPAWPADSGRCCDWRVALPCSVTTAAAAIMPCSSSALVARLPHAEVAGLLARSQARPGHFTARVPLKLPVRLHGLALSALEH
jgi:hypothetical protein